MPLIGTACCPLPPAFLALFWPVKQQVSKKPFQPCFGQLKLPRGLSALQWSSPYNSLPVQRRALASEGWLPLMPGQSTALLGQFRWQQGVPRLSSSPGPLAGRPTEWATWPGGKPPASLAVQQHRRRKHHSVPSLLAPQERCWQCFTALWGHSDISRSAIQLPPPEAFPQGPRCFCWASLSDPNYTSTAEAPATFQGIFPAQSLPGAQSNMALHSTWGAQQLPESHAGATLSTVGAGGLFTGDEEGSGALRKARKKGEAEVVRTTQAGKKQL